MVGTRATRVSEMHKLYLMYCYFVSHEPSYRADAGTEASISYLKVISVPFLGVFIIGVYRVVGGEEAWSIQESTRGFIRQSTQLTT